MNYNDYLNHVMSHAKPLPLETDLHHMCLGLTSEAGEIADAIKAHMIYDKPLDVVNIGEEMGDGLWFAGGLARLLNLDFNDVVVAALANNVAHGRHERLWSHAGWLVDAAAALHCYVINYTDDQIALKTSAMMAELVRYVRNLKRVGECFGITIEAAAKANMVKLDLRYGGGEFSAERGLNRDKAAEHRAIEQALGLAVAG